MDRDSSDISVVLESWEIKVSVDQKLKANTSYFLEFQTYLEDENARKPSAFFITTNDEVYALGYNNQDNLLALSGDDFAKNVVVDKPRKINVLSGKNIRKILMSERFGAAVTKNGQLVYWGMAMEQIQFDGKNRQYIRPPHEPQSGMDIFDFACGAHSITMITTTGDIYLWGCINLYYSEFYNFSKISLRSGVEIESISCGWYHVAMMDRKGEVWTFGYGSVGQLGYSWSSAEFGYTTPKKVQLPGKCNKVECGAYSTLFLMENGDVYACGSNSQSDHLCVGKTGFVTKPVRISFIEPITDIAATYAWSSAERWQSVFGAYSDSTKKYFRWGDDVNLKTPEIKQNVKTFSNIFITYRTPPSLANRSGITPVLWGENGLLKQKITLQDNSILRKWSAFDKIESEHLHNISAFAVFSNLYNRHYTLVYTSFIVTHGDQVYGIGHNGRDQLLGIPYKDEKTSIEIKTPVLIPQLSGRRLSKILVNSYGAVALTKLGVLYNWGGSFVPGAIAEGVSDVDMGYSFIVYLARNGDIIFNGRMDYQYSWERNKKMEIPGDDKIVELSAGDSHCAFLSVSSKAYTCGSGRFGQLGYEWETDSSPLKLRPVNLPDDCVKVQCGVDSTFFLTVRRELYACGVNKYNVVGPPYVHKIEWGTSPQKLVFPESVMDFAVSSVNRAGVRLSFIAVETSSGKIYKWGGGVETPSTEEGVISIIEAFADLEIPHSLSLVRLATDNNNRVLGVDNSAFRLLGDPLFSDITIKLADGTIPAHKGLLHANSALFRRLLADGRSNKGELDLTKYNVKAVRGMLKYIYDVEISQNASSMHDVIDFLEFSIIEGNEKLIRSTKQLADANILKTLLTWYASKKPEDESLKRLVSYFGKPSFP